MGKATLKLSVSRGTWLVHMQQLQETGENSACARCHCFWSLKPDLWDILHSIWIIFGPTTYALKAPVKFILAKFHFENTKRSTYHEQAMFCFFAHILMTPNNFQESQFISTNRSRQIAPLVENQMQPRYYRHHADPILVYSRGFRSSPPQSHICKYVCVYAHIQVPLSFNLSFFSMYKGSTHLTETIIVTQIQDF